MKFRSGLMLDPRPRLSWGRRATWISASLAASAAFGALAAVPASAASNPGTGDSGFFTFRPSEGVGGTQINVASGNALVRTRDLVDGPLTYHVVVDRAYNSLSPDTFTILSPRWGFDVGPDTKLTVESNQDATVRGPSGYRIRFERQSDGSYVAPEGFDGTLVKTPIGWTLTRTSQSDEFGFDGSGNLTWTKDSSLRDFTVQGTSAAGRTVLSSYGTHSGRRVNLSYTGNSLVRLMDDPASGHHSYRYTSGRLTEYESPLGQITSYGYDSNGFLDEIVEPGGTTVELDVLSSGKVNAITTTLPGGVPQTTGFVYTRRTYKTDVTAPDSTRRTYAYDDDWRVTRDYDPDVVPTVTASGELRDLEDDYVGPDQPYALSVGADQPDGAGLRRLVVERDNGDEIEGENVPCTSTPFDLVCPTQRTTSLDVSFANVPEGEQMIRAAAPDDEEHHATSDAWRVLVDKTAPSAASDFQLSYFDPSDPTASATINWELPTDPDLPGDLPGSGIAKVEARYRIGVGAWSPWLASGGAGANQQGEDEVTDGDLAFFGGQDGQHVTVEVRAVDAVGNVSPTSSETITLTEQLEDPEIQAMAADYYVEEYGGTVAGAKTWLAVQDKTDGLGPAVSQALPSGGYAGVWLDNETQRVKVGLRTGTPHAPALQVIADRGLGASTDIVTTTYTQGQLEQAQLAIEDELEDLIGLIEISRNPAANAVEIEVGASASPAQRLRIQQVADDAPVRVNIVESDLDDMSGETVACKFPYCEGPLRGGIGIGFRTTGNPDFGKVCTSGFNAIRREDSHPLVLTAGHCFTAYPTATSWGTRLLKKPWFRDSWFKFIGNRSSDIEHSSKGDAGAIVVSSSSDFYNPQERLPIVFVTRSVSGSTVRSTNYSIRGVMNSVKDRILCVSGASHGSRCITVEKINATFRGGGVTVKHLARARGCGVTHGDSGGPVFKLHQAYGMLTGRRNAAGLCHVWYQGAGNAQNLMKADILLRR